MPISPSHLHKKGQSNINWAGGLRRLALGVSALRAPRDGASARREALKDLPLRCAQVFWCSLPELASDLSRSAWVPWVGHESCARRERGAARAFALNAREGSGCRRSNARYGPIPLRQRRMPLAQWPNPVPAQVPDKVPSRGSDARFRCEVPDPGRLSAARNFRQGQGGSEVVYPLRYSTPDPTQ